jgi:hypothetical protein
MQMHELIDREDPRCLYCKSECDIQLDGLPVSPRNAIAFNVDILTCRKCKEVFEIHSWENDPTEIADFVFSCKTISVMNKYDGMYQGFHIGPRSNLWPSIFNVNNSTRVPPFAVDFSDKKKLFAKLKTYLVFS